MRGKALAVFASAAILQRSDASMTATLDTCRLERLTHGYGIGINQDLVVDPGAAWVISVLGEAHRLSFPAILKLTAATKTGGEGLDAGSVNFFRMDEAVFPFASSLVLLPPAQPAEVRVRAVAHSTPAAWVESQSPVDLSPDAEWQLRGSPGRRIIAAVAEGRLPSAFPGTQLAVPSRAAAFCRVFVVASGLFPVNPFAYAGLSESNPTPPFVAGDRLLLAVANLYAQQNLTNAILVLKNTLDWMTSDPDLLETASRPIDEYARR